MRTATRSRSLRTKILAWSLIPTVAVLAAIALVSHFGYQAMAHDLVLERDRELTRLLAEQLGSQLAEYAGSPANLSRAEGIYEQEIISEQTLFRRLVSSIRPRTGADGVAYLVNAEGEIILHSDRSRVGDRLSGLTAVDAVLLGGPGAIRTYDERGLQVLSSYAPVPGTTWGLIIEQPWSTLTTSITSYQRAILGLIAGGLVLLAVVIVAGVRRMTGPLRDLVSASRAISDGDFQTRVQVATGDEIETLATQFNRMSIRLQDSYQALARRVTLRGRELTALNEVTSASSLSRDLPDVLSAALQALIQALGLEAAAIGTLDRGSDELVFAAGLGPHATLEAMRSPSNLGALYRRALADAPAYPSADAQTAGPGGETLAGSLDGTGRWDPVAACGRPMGVLAVLRRVDQTSGPKSTALTTSASSSAGDRSHRLFADAQRRADLFQLLSDVGASRRSVPGRALGRSST
jgi:HAMP domain-containing protein